MVENALLDQDTETLLEEQSTHKVLTEHDLREYQLLGIDFLINKERAMLLDQPGLGKTIQAILAAQTPCLVVCPNYLTEQWASVLTAQYPLAKIRVAQGTKNERQAALLRPNTDWMIVNHEMTRQYVFDTDQYQTMIIDESHHFRHQDTQQAKGALDLARSIPRVYLLTATPIVKDPDDLFMQLRLIDPEKFTSYYQFINTYLRAYNTSYGYKIYGVNHQRMDDMMAIHSLGRTYHQVKLQLPRLISTPDMKITFDLPPDLRKKYNMTRDYWRNEEKTYSNALAAMQALRQITNCDEKANTISNLIEDLQLSARSQSDRAIIVFSHYRATARRLADKLDGTYVSGDVAPAARVLKAKNSHIVCATLESMSEGIDLSHARTVIFAEEPWTPGTAIQALARVRRWSDADKSEVPVLCYYVMASHTIDVTVHERVKSRKETLSSIVNAELDEVDA